MRNNQFPGRSVTICEHGMVATSQPVAAQVGLDILRRGGNAMDAAIAVSAALCVLEPYSTGIGGDCFVLYHEARSGKLHGLNGSGRAGSKAGVDALRSAGYNSMPQKGIHAVTVPGAIDAWYTASQALGKLEFAELLQGAIQYAENGYALTPVVAKVWQETSATLKNSASAKRIFLKDGEAPKAGDKHRQKDLARTLKLIAQHGRDAFYEGEIAQKVIDFCDQEGGFLTPEDLASHSSNWVNPISTQYRGVELFEIPPSGQGITALMALNILSNENIAAIEHLSPEHIHFLSEAFTLAVAERDRFVSDPAFANLPIEELLSAEFATRQYRRINKQQALPQPVESAFPKHQDTVYLTVVDRDRNACSFINSTFSSWGSGLVAGDTGIILQNRGAGFRMQEGHFNCIEPKKRPLHTIIPAMAYRDKKPWIAFGVMGGHYQAMGQTYVLSNLLDYGMDIQEAIDAPRFQLYEGVLSVEQGIARDKRTALVNFGHDVQETAEPLGGGQGILIDWERGTLQGGSDPRKDGCAVGY